VDLDEGSDGGRESDAGGRTLRRADSPSAGTPAQGDLSGKVLWTQKAECGDGRLRLLCHEGAL